MTAKSKSAKKLTKAEALKLLDKTQRALDKAKLKIKGLDGALGQAVGSMLHQESTKRILRDLWAVLRKHKRFAGIRASIPRKLLSEIRAACADD